MLWTIAAALIAISAFLYILFVRDSDIPAPIAVSPIQHLDDRKQAIYENLRDLQFEFRLGKLSDEDYAQTKQALQRELATVLAETEATLNRLGMTSKLQAKPTPKPAGSVCPHCSATFPQALKFCGECGKSMA